MNAHLHLFEQVEGEPGRIGPPLADEVEAAVALEQVALELAALERSPGSVRGISVPEGRWRSAVAMDCDGRCASLDATVPGSLVDA